MKHQFGGGEQRRDWWDEATPSPPGSSATSDGAGCLLTLHQCFFTWLLGRGQGGTDCSHILHNKGKPKPNKTKSRTIKSYSEWVFISIFPLFQGKLPLSCPLLQPLPKHAQFSGMAFVDCEQSQDDFQHVKSHCGSSLFFTCVSTSDFLNASRTHTRSAAAHHYSIPSTKFSAKFDIFH